jgi:hypothetical protein
MVLAMVVWQVEVKYLVKRTVKVVSLISEHETRLISKLGIVQPLIRIKEPFSFL